MSVSKGAWNGRERVEKGAEGVENFNFQWDFQLQKLSGSGHIGVAQRFLLLSLVFDCSC